LRKLAVHSLDIIPPAELCAASEQGCCSRRDAEAHGVAQREAPAEAENDARQHAVAGADRALGLDRYRSDVLAALCRCHQSAPRAERQNHNLGTALRNHLMDSLLFIRLIADLPTDKVLELAQAWLQQMDTAPGRYQCQAGGVEYKALPVPLHQLGDTRIKIFRNAERQAAAGDDVCRAR
jgi:hypothetical protein